jgi:hypothetical protein
MITHAASTRAVRPCSHAPATSAAAACSGRNTERIPWVIHFSGNNAATCCIHPGSSGKAKKTPEKNCRTTANADTAVVTDVALPGRVDAATPSTVPASAPSASTQAKVSQRPASVGSGTS